jgi:hypothetical protein
MSTHRRRPEWRHLLLVAGVTFGVVWAIAGAKALASGPTERTAAPVTFTTATTRAHAGAAIKTGTVLGGFTSQGWPVVIKMSRDHRHIVRVGIGLTMRCTSGTQLALRDGGGSMPIGTDGKVHMAVTIPPTAGSAASIAGGSDMFTGRLERGNTAFAGAWDLRIAFTTPDGHKDTCSSGRVTFAAT